MSWCIYLLCSGNRTYIGSTTDVQRRLRQHNGEIRGGARATRGRTWKIACYISGFSGRSQACRWEKIVKSRCRGYAQRRNAMLFLGVFSICPEKGREYPVPKGLEFHNDCT